jgi:hypothetical protein
VVTVIDAAVVQLIGYSADMSPRGGAAALRTGRGTAFVLIAIVAAGYILAILRTEDGSAHPLSVDPGVFTGYMIV